MTSKADRKAQMDRIKALSREELVEGEAEVLKRWGLDHALKSGCWVCPAQTMGWYWVLRELHPDRWETVKTYEARALALNKKMTVCGSAALTDERLDTWRAENPGATILSVLQKAYSRCIDVHSDVEGHNGGGDEATSWDGVLALVRARDPELARWIATRPDLAEKVLGELGAA